MGKSLREGGGEKIKAGCLLDLFLNEVALREKTRRLSVLLSHLQNQNLSRNLAL